MKRKGLTFAALAGCALVLTGLSTGATTARTKVHATMLSRQEVPALAVAAPRAHGTLNGLMIKRRGRMVLTYSLNYRHLTSRATAAHIQIGAAGTAGPIVVTLCAPCGLTAGGAKLLPPKAVQAIRNGTAYVNVHTRKNPKGEIRGQLRILS